MSTTSYRYEVGWETSDGSLDTSDWYDTLAPAMRYAEKIFRREGHTAQGTFVLDRMAHVDGPELREFDGKNWKVTLRTRSREVVQNAKPRSHKRK